MYQLLTGYNAITWLADDQLIAASSCLPVIEIVYARNLDTGQGFVSYQPIDALSVMNRFVNGVEYLIKATGNCLLDGAGPASAGAFSDFKGYTPPAVNTAPTAPAGRVENGIAAESIIGGRMVAQTSEGLRHYDSAVAAHRNLLFGVALNSALVGGSVSVRRPGYVFFQGWGLPPNVLLLAGNDGKLVTSVSPPSFLQVIGRSITADALLYQPGEISLILQPQSTL